MPCSYNYITTQRRLRCCLPLHRRRRSNSCYLGKTRPAGPTASNSRLNRRICSPGLGSLCLCSGRDPCPCGDPGGDYCDFARGCRCESNIRCLRGRRADCPLPHLLRRLWATCATLLSPLVPMMLMKRKASVAEGSWERSVVLSPLPPLLTMTALAVEDTRRLSQAVTAVRPSGTEGLDSLKGSWDTV